MIDTIFLDMDGVLVDFVGGICKAHKRLSPFSKCENMGQYDLPKLLGMDQERFWAKAATKHFWSNLAPLPCCVPFVSLAERLVGFDHLFFLSSPCLSSDCWSGKAAWVVQNLGKKYASRLIITAPVNKSLLAAPTRLLIDDCDLNVDRWRDAGGVATLCPRPWNRLFGSANVATSYVVEEMQQHRAEISAAVETPKASVRTFATGATRNPSDGKPDYEGFLSPAVVEAFGGYMHKHRVQADGSLRASDNWQRGIPSEEYMKSAWRHFMAWWKIHRGGKVTEDGREVTAEEAICALLFNAQGYLHELLNK